MTVSLYSVIRILKYWDITSTTELQYSLEKRNYLVNTIIYFSTIVKIVPFMFFIKTIDDLSLIVPGAMCSAGVIGANGYGNILLLLKILIIFDLGIWLIINKMDLSFTNFPYLRPKYYMFIVSYFLICSEFILEILFFSNVPLKVPVFCCSTVFQVGDLPFGLNIPFLLVIYYLLAILVYISNLQKNALNSFISGILFLFASFYAITYFFGTYVYELPTHKCPYCMLQKEYAYVGYLVWITVFLSVFYSISGFVVELVTKQKYENGFKYARIFTIISVVVCTFFVLKYYLLNGVLL